MWKDAHIAANYRGFYNIYNILAAYSAARTAGLKLDHFDRVLRDFNPQNGRNELFPIGKYQGASEPGQKSCRI